MDVFKTHLFLADHDKGRPYLIDTIFHEGRWWLVGSWLESHDTGERVPERLVLLEILKHREVDHPDYRFWLSTALPKSVLDGTEQEGYVVAMYQGLDDTPGPTDSRPH